MKYIAIGKKYTDIESGATGKAIDVLKHQAALDTSRGVIRVPIPRLKPAALFADANFRCETNAYMDECEADAYLFDWNDNIIGTTEMRVGSIGMACERHTWVVCVRGRKIARYKSRLCAIKKMWEHRYK